MALTLGKLKEIGLVRACQRHTERPCPKHPDADIGTFYGNEDCTDCWLATCEAVVREAAEMAGNVPFKSSETGILVYDNRTAEVSILSRFDLTADDADKEGA